MQNKITGRKLRICHDYRLGGNIKMGCSCEAKNWSSFLQKLSTENGSVIVNVNQSWGSAKPEFFKTNYKYGLWNHAMYQLNFLSVQQLRLN
jgi:hypothetical protein